MAPLGKGDASSRASLYWSVLARAGVQQAMESHILMHAERCLNGKGCHSDIFSHALEVRIPPCDLTFIRTLDCNVWHGNPGLD